LVLGITSRISQLSVRTTLDSRWQLLDLRETSINVNDWKTVLDALNEVLSGLDILLGRISSLGLAEFAWEQDKAGAVFL